MISAVVDILLRIYIVISLFKPNRILGCQLGLPRDSEDTWVLRQNLHVRQYIVFVVFLWRQFSMGPYTGSINDEF